MATIWANQQRKLILDNPAVYSDWNAFATALYEHFSLQNDEAEAIHAIRTIDMGTGSAEDYTTIFKTYQTRCGYNDVALIEEYRRGLKKSLEERCRMTYPKPSKLTEWMERAVNIDKEYQIG